MPRLNDKVAIITGGAGGIGKVTARRFLQEGAKVTIVDLAQDALDSARKELGEPRDLLAVRADVANEADVKNESSFVNDLGADSLDTVELVMALEEEFETEIPDEEAQKITTVQQAVDYIKAHSKA